MYLCNAPEFSTLYMKPKLQGNGGNSGVTLKIKYKINIEKGKGKFLDDLIKGIRNLPNKIVHIYRQHLP